MKEKSVIFKLWMELSLLVLGRCNIYEYALSRMEDALHGMEIDDDALEQS